MDLSHRAGRRNIVEQRRTHFREMEMRAKPDGTGGELLHFSGYASVTEAPYEMDDLFGAYTEVVRRGSFAKTLAEGCDVPFKLNHDGISLARTKSGTMRLLEDSTGLLAEADLDPSSPAVQTIRSAMERGDLDEMSFAFRVTRQEWSRDYTQRDILEVNLSKGDVSVVNYGANPHTTGATLRGRDVVSALCELRAGATLTPDAMATLGHVLAEVLGVPNPDAILDEVAEAVEPDPMQEQEAAGLELYQFRRRLLAL